MSMNSIKCQSCGLTNFSSQIECRRCGYGFTSVGSKKAVGKRPRSFSLSSLLLLAAAGGLVYYVFKGTEQSMDEINANEAKRVAAQPAERPAAGLSRTQYDQQRAGHYGNAVANSPSLGAHQKHIDETQKAMQQVSNSSASK
jgi:uncharacterized protein HemX